MIYSRKNAPVEQFVAKGFPEREFFSHRVVAIAKQYPDTFLLLKGRGVPRSEVMDGRFCQINLYSDHVGGLPPELFVDRSVNWHGQQLFEKGQMGEKALIAAAGLYVQENSLIVTLLQSDLCQQLYRHSDFKRTCKTQVDNRFGYWYRILFNAILDFAIECGATTVCCPTAAWIVNSTEAPVRPDLFSRIYDSPARHYQCRRVTRANAEYWEVPLADNAGRVVRLTPTAPPAVRDDSRSSICIFHDTEENVDTDVPVSECQRNLTAMLAIEKSRGVRATYNILGNLLERKRDEIRTSDPRHSLAFHSFNHDLTDESQLDRCREVDMQIRGYRPPRSVITPELTDYRLSFLNFEWLASATSSLHSSRCVLQNGIVKIPIATDDYGLATGQMEYAQWESRLPETARQRKFFAFGLHDCYANTWLDSYASLLDRLGSIGDFVTADEICCRTFWEQGVDIPPISPITGLSEATFSRGNLE